MSWLTLLAVCLSAAPSLVINGDLEAVENGYPKGWSKAWARAGESAVRTEMVDGGAVGPHCLHVVHTGQQDWSLAAPLTITHAKPGEVLALSVRIKLLGSGHVVLCGTFLPEQGADGAIWSASPRQVSRPQNEWQEVTTRCLVPVGLPRLMCRVIGSGPVDFLVDGFVVQSLGDLASLRGAYHGPASLAWSSSALGVTVRPDGLSFEVADRRTGRTWRLAGPASFVAKSVKVDGDTATVDGEDLLSGSRAVVSVRPVSTAAGR